MATKFRRDATNAKPPAWCFAAVFPPTIALVDGNPSRLVCFAYWTDLNVVPAIDTVQSFILRYRPGPDDWLGESATSGLRLKVKVRKQHDSPLYQIILEVLRDAVLLDDDSWHDVDAGKLPLFDSMELHHVHDPAVDQNGIHVVS